MKTILLCIGLTATAGFAATSYVLHRQDGETQKVFPFIYYPSLNLYYDVSDNCYVYPVDHNGSRLWDRIPKRTAAVPATLGRGVVFYSSNPEVWQENEVHLKQYGSTLLPAADSVPALSAATAAYTGPDLAHAPETAVLKEEREEKKEVPEVRPRKESRYEQELKKKLQKSWAGKEWKEENEDWN